MHQLFQAKPFEYMNYLENEMLKNLKGLSENMFMLVMH